MNELVPAVLNAPLSNRRWTDRFVMDLAMTLEGSGNKIGTLLAEYDLEPTDLEAFALEPLFIQRMEHFKKEVKERGFLFKAKAQIQAEELLETSWKIIHDQEVSPAVKADLIKWTSKVAGFEPTGDKGVGVGNAVQININMGDPTLAAPAGVRTIDNV